MNPLAMKNTKTTSQTIVDENPWSDSFAKSKVLVTVQQCNPSRAITGIGNGFKIIPLIVPINIARSFHAFLSSTSGFGNN